MTFVRDIYVHERLDYSLLQAKAAPPHILAVQMYSRLTPYFPDFMYTSAVKCPPRHYTHAHQLNGHESEQVLGDKGQGSLQSMGLQRVGHNWVTEQQMITVFSYLQRKMFPNVFFKNSYFDTISDLEKDYKMTKDSPNVDIFPPICFIFPLVSQGNGPKLCWM